MTNDDAVAPETPDTAPQPRPRRSVWSQLIPTAVMLIGLVLFGYFSTLPRNAVTWTEFVPASGEFSVLMPATPKESQETQGLLTLTVTTRTFKATAAGGTEQCSVAIYDLSELARDVLGSDEELLETMCDGMALKGRKLSDVRAVGLSGYPGRELVCERPRIGGFVLNRTRMCLAGRRLYVVTFASWRQPRLWSNEAEKFLASFKLIGEAPAKLSEMAAPGR